MLARCAGNSQVAKGIAQGKHELYLQLVWSETVSVEKAGIFSISQLRVDAVSQEASCINPMDNLKHATKCIFLIDVHRLARAPHFASALQPNVQKECVTGQRQHRHRLFPASCHTPVCGLCMKSVGLEFFPSVVVLLLNIFIDFYMLLRADFKKQKSKCIDNTSFISF